MLALPDYAVIVFYLGFMVAVGWFFRRFAHDSSEYFRGGARMPWWMVGASSFISSFSVWTFTGAVGLAYDQGVVVFVIFWASAVALVFSIWFAAARYRQARAVTIMEMVRQRLGPANEQVFTWLKVPMGLILSAIWLYSLAVFCAPVFGLEVHRTIVIAGGIVLVLTAFGGSWAVVAGGFVQSLVLIPVGIVVAACAWQRIGGWHGLVSQLPPSHGDLLARAAPDLGAFWIVAMLLDKFFQVNGVIDSGKYFCVRDGAAARRTAALMFVLTAIGPALWFFPVFVARAEHLDLAGLFPQLARPAEGAYIAIAHQMLPAGLLGFMVTAIVSTTLSSMDVGLNGNAGILVRSVYLRLLRPAAGDREQVLVGRLSTLLFGILVILIALLYNTWTHVTLFSLMLQFQVMISTPLAVPLFWSMWIRRTPEWTAWATVLLGVVFWLIVAFLAQIPHPASPLLAWAKSHTYAATTIADTFGCSVFFVGCGYLPRRFHSTREGEVRDFFARVNRPVGAEEAGDEDFSGIRKTGRLCLGYAVFILALALLPNTPTDRVKIIFCAGVVAAVGWLLGRHTRSTRPARLAGNLLMLGGATLLLATKCRAADSAPVSLPPVPFTVRVKPELLGVHPRIFFDRPGLEGAKAKLSRPGLQPLRAQFLAGANHLLAAVPPAHPPQTDDPFRSFGNRLNITAFAYLLTGDSRYLDNTRTWMKALNGYLEWSNDDDLGCGHCLMGMALAYDWLYDRLTPQERAATEASLLVHSRHMLVRSQPYQPGSNWGWTYFQGHEFVNYNGVAFAAMALLDVHGGEVQGWLDLIRSRFQFTYQGLGIDGGSYEGPAYEHYATQQILLYLDSLRVLTGENLFDMPYLKRIGYYELYNEMPDWKNVANFGDSCETGRGVVNDEIPFKLAALQHDGHFLTYREKCREVSGDEPLTAFAVLWVDPRVQPTTLDDVPLAGLFPDLGLVSFRTSWKPDAAVVSLHCGAPGGQFLTQHWRLFPGANAAFSHVHPDANSFLLWSGGQWRISNPGAYTRDKVTHNENVWTVSGEGQRGRAQWFDARSYLNRDDQAHLVAVGTTPAADYAVGEAAPAYEPGCQLRSFRRHLLFIKGSNPYVVVYDRLQSQSPQSWSAFLHGNTPFTADGEHSAFRTDAPAMFGILFGPDRRALEAHPLFVQSHPDMKRVQSGYELEIRPEGKTDATWLVAVIGAEALHPTQLASRGDPAIQVGDDRIAWDRDEVSFNGQTVTANLLPTASGR